MIRDRLRPTSPMGRAARAAPIALLAALGACVSILPKTPPVQLYRFGDRPAAAASSTAVQGRGANVVLSTVSFPRESVGDALLTVQGAKLSYIDGGRWAAPAVVLFREAVGHAFDADGDRVHLLSLGDVGGATATLRLDVTRFEARYENGTGAPPTVAVTVDARLNAADGRLLDARTFTALKPASDNRMGPIVAAYDDAVTDVLGRVATWTAQLTPAG